LTHKDLNMKTDVNLSSAERTATTTYNPPHHIKTLNVTLQLIYWAFSQLLASMHHTVI